MRDGTKLGGGKVTRLELVSPCTHQRLGHLALEPNWILKAQRVGLLDAFVPVLNGATVNPCLRTYWLAAGLEEGPVDGQFNSYPGSLALTSGTTGYPAHDEVQEAWERLGIGSILMLTDEHRKRGWAALRAAGFNAPWFVCLDVRSRDYLGAGSAYHDYRNASLESHLSAVEEIVGMGGGVIRVGSAASRLESDDVNVLDYAHRFDLQSDWMDIFIMGGCTFFLGTSSGPHNVACIFGRPCIGTNWTPCGHGSPASQDVYIPKLYKQHGRLLSFAEMITTDVSQLDRAEWYAERGIEVVDNEPEDIVGAVKEVASVGWSREQRAYQALLRSRHNYHGSLSRVAQSFLEKHRDLL